MKFKIPPRNSSVFPALFYDTKRNTWKKEKVLSIKKLKFYKYFCCQHMLYVRLCKTNPLYICTGRICLQRSYLVPVINCYFFEGHPRANFY
jgi:hypothetical protein